MNVLDRIPSSLPPPQPNRRDPFALLRNELPLKMIALATALLLHLFVQAERNPTQTRAIVAQIVIERMPPNTDVKNEGQALVNVTGPRTIVERIKDTDIQAIADLTGIKADNDNGQMVRVRFVAPNVPQSAMLRFEPPTRMVRMQIFQPEARQMRVEANFPQEPAAGYDYGRPEVRPARVTVRGMPDAVRKVDTLKVVAVPLEPGGTIEGQFPVLVRDAKDRPVENVTVEPSMVQVTVPLVARPPKKIVPISPKIIDLPLLPYRLEEVRVTPNQVQIVGRPERLKQIGTLETEDVSVRDMTETRTIEVGLQKPVDASVQDMSGKPISRVRVQFVIRRTVTPDAKPPAGQPESPAGNSPP
jgi:YbbR domain-containing protein